VVVVTVMIRQPTLLIKRLHLLYEFAINNLPSPQKKNFLNALISINKDVPKLKRDAMNMFFDNLSKKINEIKPLEWSLKIDVNKLSTKSGFPLRLVKDGNKLVIGFEFNLNDFKDARIGVVRISPNVDINKLCESSEIRERLKTLKHKYYDYDFPKSPWWLTDSLKEGDLWDRIIADGEDVVLDYYVSKFKDLIDDFEVICNLSAE
jgi:hypothetical protein